ncbi:vanadium-dependent haloperoxidase [Dokdonia sp. Hel_I_53]|uniref:vanadium-dependent haloperoxidase n=1 Tax=Dokdonia sp. Hel_I_53 TaxID=1566287 RepID=UPI00119B9662|nr:vanadium-dependent haloperoxidase [Dokdonia sp. Hel_I_53]TVZ52904.1 PAP2 superfamily protein [Dokdonia sp. Hel_I_53]
MKSSIVIFLSFFCIMSCKKNEEPIVITPDHFHTTIDKVTDVIIHDIFSPPVASRIYAYPNIAAYEILALKDNGLNPLSGQLKDLNAIPKPALDAPVNYELSALMTHIELSKRLIFSENKIEIYRDSLYKIWESKNDVVFNSSKKYAAEVTGHIADWMDKDNYKQTRTMPKFSVFSDEPSRWQPTPPAYMDGIEPHWNKIRPFVIRTADQFKPIPPPAFSMQEGSDFYKQVKEVYDISQQITADGDNSEEIAIAQFWDCNPYVSVTRGHLMFATKKITPGGHWMGITKIAAKKSGFDVSNTLYAYAKTSVAMADAFISCWDEKYRSNLIRPETLINDHIDDAWKPILQTPPFPEYVSGHSVVSGAAAESLTSIFGTNFSFLDDTETPYGLPVREFKSFKAAAQEAAVSRMYGGIHYRVAVDEGLKQGIALGKYVVTSLQMKNNTQLSFN